MKHLILILLILIPFSYSGIAFEVSYFDLGNRYFVKGEFDKALDQYSKVLESTEKEFQKEAMFMTGRCHEMLGRNDDAYRIYKEFISKYPDSKESPQIQFSLAMSDLKNGESTTQLETLKTLDRIIVDYPEFKDLKEVFEQKIKILIRMEAWSDAKNLIEKLLKDSDTTDFDRYYFHLAEIYSNPKFQDNDNQKALEIYKKIINDYPGSDLVRNCYFSIAHIYKTTEDWQNAIKYYRLVSREYPEEVLSLLANTMVQICYIKRNEFLYGTKSKTALTKIFGGQNLQKPSLEEGILRDIEEEAHVKLDIYADDSFKNPERAVYTGNVNVKKGDLEIQANNVDCDLKNQILYIKGSIRLVKQKKLLLKGESLEYDVPKNRIIAKNELNIITVKAGKVVEKKGSKVLFELDSGKILIDNVEYKEE